MYRLQENSKLQKNIFFLLWAFFIGSFTFKHMFKFTKFDFLVCGPSMVWLMCRKTWLCWQKWVEIHCEQVEQKTHQMQVFRSRLFETFLMNVRLIGGNYFLCGQIINLEILVEGNSVFVLHGFTAWKQPHCCAYVH